MLRDVYSDETTLLRSLSVLHVVEVTFFSTSTEAHQLVHSSFLEF